MTTPEPEPYGVEVGRDWLVIELKPYALAVPECNQILVSVTEQQPYFFISARKAKNHNMVTVMYWRGWRASNDS